MAREVLAAAGAVPGFVLANGPRATCITVAGQRVSSGRLRDGELVGVDVGCRLDGWYADVAGTWCVGEVDENRKALLEAGAAALAELLRELTPGRRWSDVKRTVNTNGEAGGFLWVAGVCGHGIGRSLHEDPLLEMSPFAPRKGAAQDANGEVDFEIQPGLVLCLEPALTDGLGLAGSENGWLSTRDGRPCVHFEGMVAATRSGVEVLAGPESWVKDGG